MGVVKRLPFWVGLSLCLAALPLWPALAQPQTGVKTLVVMGSGEIRDNVTAAREKAIADALVGALAKVAAEMLPPAGFVDNFARLNEDIFASPNTHVASYRVLAEHKGRVHYRVLVEATVALDRFAEKLGGTTAAPVATPPQRFLLLLAEHLMPGEPLQGWWMGQEPGAAQTALARALTLKGLDVIAASQPVEATFWRPELTDAEAIEIAKRLEAQAVVVGTATTTSSANVMGINIRSFQALVKVRILRTDPAGQIGLSAQSADTTGTDAAESARDVLAKAGEAVGQQIIEMISGQGLVQQAVPTTVEIVVSGARNLTDLVQFRRILSETPGVTGIKMVEMRTEQAILAVDFKDRGPKLAEALLKHTHAAFAIRIAESKAQQLRIELMPAEPGTGGFTKP